MKVQAALCFNRHRLEEPVQQPALAAAHRTVQVQAAWLPLFEQCQLFGHAVDHPSLAVTQLVTAASGFVLEPVEQFALVGGGAAQALAKLAQWGRDPGRQKQSSLAMTGQRAACPRAAILTNTESDRQ